MLLLSACDSASCCLCPPFPTCASPSPSNPLSRTNTSPQPEKISRASPPAIYFWLPCLWEREEWTSCRAFQGTPLPRSYNPAPHPQLGAPFPSLNEHSIYPKQPIHIGLTAFHLLSPTLNFNYFICVFAFHCNNIESHKTWLTITLIHSKINLTTSKILFILTTHTYQTLDFNIFKG